MQKAVKEPQRLVGEECRSFRDASEIARLIIDVMIEEVDYACKAQSVLGYLLFITKGVL